MEQEIFRVNDFCVRFAISRSEFYREVKADRLRWTPSVGQETGGLKRESRRLSFSGYAASNSLSEAITFLS